MKERHTALVNYVIEHGRTDVAKLADVFHTSKVTIRKDLEYLAQNGLLKREHGYALPNDPGDINYHMAFDLDDKQRIAKAAADLVGEGETIIVEAGSTCALLAAELADRRKNVTIITNSTYLASYVPPSPGIRIVLLGGILQPHSQALVGPLTKQAVSSFHVDKIFAGTDGYSRELGFTGDDMIRTETLEAMLRSANHAYVLTTASKFSHQGSVSFLSIDNVYQLITNDGIDAAEAEYLRSRGVRVTIV